MENEWRAALWRFMKTSQELPEALKMHTPRVNAGRNAAQDPGLSACSGRETGKSEVSGEIPYTSTARQSLQRRFWGIGIVHLDEYVETHRTRQPSSYCATLQKKSKFNLVDLLANVNVYPILNLRRRIPQCQTLIHTPLQQI